MTVVIYALILGIIASGIFAGVLGERARRLARARTPERATEPGSRPAPDLSPSEWWSYYRFLLGREYADWEDEDLIRLFDLSRRVFLLFLTLLGLLIAWSLLRTFLLPSGVHTFPADDTVRRVPDATGSNRFLAWWLLFAFLWWLLYSRAIRTVRQRHPEHAGHVGLKYSFQLAPRDYCTHTRFWIRREYAAWNDPVVNWLLEPLRILLVSSWLLILLSPLLLLLLSLSWAHVL